MWKKKAIEILNTIKDDKLPLEETVVTEAPMVKKINDTIKKNWKKIYIYESFKWKDSEGMAEQWNIFKGYDAAREEKRKLRREKEMRKKIKALDSPDSDEEEKKKEAAEDKNDDKKEKKKLSKGSAKKSMCTVSSKSSSMRSSQRSAHMPRSIGSRGSLGLPPPGDPDRPARFN